MGTVTHLDPPKHEQLSTYVIPTGAGCELPDEEGDHLCVATPPHGVLQGWQQVDDKDQHHLQVYGAHLRGTVKHIPP